MLLNKILTNEDLQRLSVSGGYFACTSDIVRSLDKSTNGEFISFLSLIDIFSAGGLEMVGVFENSLSNAFVGDMDYAVSRVVLRKPGMIDE